MEQIKKLTKEVYASIAGHTMRLTMPETLDLSRSLPSFADFFVPEFSEEHPDIKVDLVLRTPPADHSEKKLLSDVSMVWGDRFRLEESTDYYITSVDADASDWEWKMYSTKDFLHSTIYTDEVESDNGNIFPWLLMVVYGQAILGRNTVMLHASVVEYDEQGYAFLGKSGTGKSTHSQLWLRHLGGATLLNDDNPVVRIQDDGRVFIYGSPWSGKTPCYKSKGVELKGIIRLQQAPHNELHWVDHKDALITLLPSCTAIRWNKGLFNNMVNSLELIIERVPIGRLACLPNLEAAKLCFNEISKR